MTSGLLARRPVVQVASAWAADVPASHKATASTGASERTKASVMMGLLGFSKRATTDGICAPAGGWPPSGLRHALQRHRSHGRQRGRGWWGDSWRVAKGRHHCPARTRRTACAESRCRKATSTGCKRTYQAKLDTPAWGVPDQKYADTVVGKKPGSIAGRRPKSMMPSSSLMVGMRQSLWPHRPAAFTSATY